MTREELIEAILEMHRHMPVSRSKAKLFSRMNAREQSGHAGTLPLSNPRMWDRVERNIERSKKTRRARKDAPSTHPWMKDKEDMVSGAGTHRARFRRRISR